MITHELDSNLLARMAGAAQALDPSVGGVLVEGALLHVYTPDDATPASRMKQSEIVKAAHVAYCAACERVDEIEKRVEQLEKAYSLAAATLIGVEP